MPRQARKNPAEHPGPQRRQSDHHVSRRRVLKLLSGLGVGSAVFRRALAADVTAMGKLTPEMIQQAEWIAGVELKPADRESAAKGLSRALAGFKQLRAVKLDNSVSPAVLFNPAPGQPPPDSNSRGRAGSVEAPALERPKSDEDLAFLPV